MNEFEKIEAPAALLTCSACDNHRALFGGAVRFTTRPAEFYRHQAEGVVLCGDCVAEIMHEAQAETEAAA